MNKEQIQGRGVTAPANKAGKGPRSLPHSVAPISLPPGQPFALHAHNVGWVGNGDPFRASPAFPASPQRIFRVRHLAACGCGSGLMA